MAHQHLWQNEHFRKAFQRWWDEDWSWEGLKDKGKRPSLGSWSDEDLGTLQDVWRGEEHGLIAFAGRQWTRFHLPPFGPNGVTCPEEVWSKAKDAAAAAEISRRLDAAVLPDEAALKGRGLDAVTEYADLRGVVFPRGSSFSQAALIGDFTSTIFLGDVVFPKQIAARFERAAFSGIAGFGRAAFSGTANFGSAAFSGDGYFGSAAFSGIAVFSRAAFSGIADFRGAAFSGTANFRSAAFSGIADFRSAAFSGTADFESAAFSGTANFRSVAFSGTADFESAAFSGTADFSGSVAFPGPVDFSSARFATEVYFSDRAFNAATDFAAAEFLGLPRFGNATLHDDTNFHGAVFVDGDKDRQFPEESGEVEEFERAYRRLRLLCAKIGNVEYEGLFHSLELKAHRARTDAQAMARVAIYLYDWMSDFGRSLTRPVLSLGAFWLVFAALYAAMFLASLTVGHACGEIDWPSPAELLTTAGHGFLPSLFGGNRVADLPGWLHCAEENDPLAYFFVSTFQNAVFIACVSLFLIALRRRFQLRD